MSIAALLFLVGIEARILKVQANLFQSKIELVLTFLEGE